MRLRAVLSSGEQLINLCDLETVTGNTYACSAAAYREGYSQGLRPLLCPDLVAQPKKLFPHPCRPFLTRQSGVLLRGIPYNLDDALHCYCISSAGRLPNVDVAERNVKVTSCSDVRHTLLAARAADKTFWAAFATDHIQHPAWWPRSALDVATGCGHGPDSVPTYDQIIVGHGRTGWWPPKSDEKGRRGLGRNERRRMEPAKEKEVAREAER